MARKISHVAIIGAGMAGMTCARVLAKAGLHVQVFEKSRGIGGRMNTRRFDDWQCDFGAQYFTAHTPAFTSQIDKWLEESTISPWAPRLAVYDQAGLREHADNKIIRYVGTPKMNAMLGVGEAAFPVHRNTRVESLALHGDDWHLRLGDGPLFPSSFDAVVCAVPAPQAIPLVEAWSGELKHMASVVEMLPCWAAAIHFDMPVVSSFDAAFVNAGPLRWIARDNSKPNRPSKETWLIHASPDWSQACLESTAEQVSTQLAQATAEILGTYPSSCHAHRWRYADIAAPLDVEAAWDAETRIGLCGDWLSAGKIEGAWNSGTKLAQWILRA